jgi:hypothetical protein
MALIDFNSQLQAADSLPDLARRLGAECIENAAELREMKSQERSAEELSLIADGVAAIPSPAWDQAIAVPADFANLAGDTLMAALQRARMRRPLDFFGVLMGLCSGALDAYFRVCTDAVELDRGLPIPFATRPPPAGVEWTTPQATLNRGSLLDPLDWSLFEFSRREEVRVVLDYSRRERIDQLTWKAAERLPRIATVHPQESAKVVAGQTGPGKFFDVKPTMVEPADLLARLATVTDAAEIAVLPELCLTHPSELEAGLKDNPDAYPPLVVAGSAHVREGPAGEGEVRANESRVYLDGEQVLAHRKHHPFRTKELNGKTYAAPLEEDLSSEQKTITVLAGMHTRLAVVICADLLDLKVPRRLIAAGVNLLLAPAMTKKVGSFATAIQQISGQCQGVSAVANARFSPAGEPFLCLLGTPRVDPAEQFAAIDARGLEPSPEVALFDSSEPLLEAVELR